MIFNTEILDAYLTEKSLEKVKNHWIFNSIVEGKYLIEEPKEIEDHKLRILYKILINELENFQPLNNDLWQRFFGNMQIPNTTGIYLIVGSPEPYDAMVRMDAEGNNCIILDLVRISSYSEDVSKLSELASSFVTHELSHILVNNKYPQPQIEASLYDSLKHIVFDEGIAHFLSHKKDILSIEWYNAEMNIKRKNAYKALHNAIKIGNDADKNQMLERANSGLYWEKFGAISGLFGIIDYYYYNNKDIKALTYLFENGPDLLMEFILNNKNCGS